EGRAPATEWPPLEVKAPIEQPPAAAVPQMAAAAQSAIEDKVAPTVQAKRSAGNLHLFIPFASPTAGAVFARDDAIWLVFDGDAAARLHQAPEFRRLLVPELGAGDRRAPEFRRPADRDRRRQGDRRPPRRLDAVGSRDGRGARPNRGAADLRSCRLEARPRP